MTSGLCGEEGRWAGRPRDARGPVRLGGGAGPRMLMALGCQWGRSAGRAGREAVAPCSGRLWAEPGPAPRAALLCRFPFFLLFYIFEKPTHSLKKKTNKPYSDVFYIRWDPESPSPPWCIREEPCVRPAASEAGGSLSSLPDPVCPQKPTEGSSACRSRSAAQNLMAKECRMPSEPSLLFLILLVFILCFHS